MNEDYSALVKENERVDDLHRNGYRLIQNPKSFCFGQDAVLLSSFAKANEGEIVLDMGTGTGVIPILMEAKTKAARFHAIEIQPDMVEMAKRSVLLNNLSHKIIIEQGDIKEISKLYKPSSFDVITTNPPYITSGGGLINGYTPKAVSRHEILCSLEDVISGAAYLLRPQGRFYVIHRPHRLADILTLLREKSMEPKTLQMVYPTIKKEPATVLIEAVRCAKPMLKVLPPLIIYDENGKYTDEVHKIYYLET